MRENVAHHHSSKKLEPVIMWHNKQSLWKLLLLSVFSHSQKCFLPVLLRQGTSIIVWWFHLFDHFTWPPWYEPRCQPWWPCSVQVKLWAVPAVAFCSSEIDELIVWLLPVCLCPGWRCPGYRWESQLWHPPWGCYCSHPAGGPGGWWPWEQLRLTYCCHTLGDTAALSPTCPSDRLRQNDSLWRTVSLQGNYLTLPNFSWWQQFEEDKRERRCRAMSFPPDWSVRPLPVSTTVLVLNHKHWTVSWNRKRHEFRILKLEKKC